MVIDVGLLVLPRSSRGSEGSTTGYHRRVSRVKRPCWSLYSGRFHQWRSKGTQWRRGKSLVDSMRSLFPNIKEAQNNGARKSDAVMLTHHTLKTPHQRFAPFSFLKSVTQLNGRARSPPHLRLHLLSVIMSVTSKQPTLSVQTVLQPFYFQGVFDEL